MFSLTKKKGNLLGIDISSSSVKLIEIGKVGGSYRLESYSVAPLPDGANSEKEIFDSEAVADSIRKVIRDSRTKRKHCVLGIPPSVAISKVISMPATIPPSELEHHVLLEAEQYLPYSMDEVNFDFEVIGPSQNLPETVDVLLAATRTENVEARVAAAELAGLKVDIVDLESHSLELLFTMLVDDVYRHDVVAVVDYGASVTGITVFEKGIATFSRELAFGGKQLTEEIMQRYGLTYQESGLAKKTGSLPEGYVSEVLDPFRENMVRQVNRFLQFYYASTQQAHVDKILLSGGGSSIPGIDEQIQSAVNIPTSLVNPFLDVKLGPRINPARFTNDIPALLVAAGLSLRGFD